MQHCLPTRRSGRIRLRKSRNQLSPARLSPEPIEFERYLCSLLSFLFLFFEQASAQHAQ
jgi:hypothetical protein